MLEMVLDTRHFECETYREVLFCFTAQKNTLTDVLNNEVILIFLLNVKSLKHSSI